MNERKTSSMLQRVPVILAVTAASYGLQLPPSIGSRAGQGVSTTITATATQSPGRQSTTTLAAGTRSANS